MSNAPQGEGWWQASDGNWYPPTATPGMPPSMPGALGAMPYMAVEACRRCGNPLAPDRIGCEVCGQVRTLPVGVNLTSAARRLGQYLLDILLFIVTLGIGWIVWSLIIWARGQTPAMQVLKIQVVKMETGRAAGWGTMALREFVGKGLIMGVIGIVPFASLVLDFMLLWTKNRQQLWDFVAGTIVVDNYPEPVAEGMAVPGAGEVVGVPPVAPASAPAPTPASAAASAPAPAAAPAPAPVPEEPGTPAP